MKLISCLIIFTFISFFSFSQVNSRTYISKLDTNPEVPIVKFNQLWTLSMPFTHKEFQFHIINHETGHSIVLLPHSKTTIGLNIIHKWFGLGISFGLRQSDEDIRRYGKTKQFDFQLNSYMRSVIFDFRIQAYKGFYRAEVPPAPDGSYPQSPDFSTYSLGGNLLFFTNKAFSYKAAYTRSEIQLKSAGSFNYGLYADMDGAKSPDAFSSLKIEEWPGEFNLLSYHSGGFGLVVGYAYTFVIKRFFFFNLSFSPKFGMRYLTYRLANQKTKFRLIGSGGAIVRMAIGYEGKYLFYGLSAVSQSNTYSQKSYEIKPVSYYGKLYVGMRF